MAGVLDRTSEESRALVERIGSELAAFGKKRNDRIVSKVGGHWIAVRSVRKGRVFAEMRPLKARVEVFILPGKEDLRGPRDFARGAPRTQGWGWFRSRFDVTSARDVRNALQLLRQSYDHVGRSRRNPARGRARRGQRV